MVWTSCSPSFPYCKNLIVVVFEILLWFVQTGSWKEAFEKVIPLRKIDKKDEVSKTTVSDNEEETSAQLPTENQM